MSLELLPATAWYTVAEFIYEIRFCLFLVKKRENKGLDARKSKKVIILILMEVLTEGGREARYILMRGYIVS